MKDIEKKRQKKLAELKKKYGTEDILKIREM